MTQVIFNKVSKIYDKDIKAVNDICLNIDSGELLVLCGPSGCGKSTVLRMLAGLEDISQGEIIINNKVINQIPPKDRDIAMVFQNYAIYPHMTVFDNIAFSLKLRKFSKKEIKSKVEKTASMLGLSDYLNRKPKTLSGGQRQRIAMGRAIVRNPSIFLFDEPLSNLDAKMRTELRKEILQIHQNVSSTILYVTHDQIEALTLGDRICVMNNGKIEQIDTPINIFNKPSSLFVAQFIGTPPMNIIEGRLIYENNQIMFVKDTVRCLLSDQNESKLTPYINKDVYLGVRALDIKISNNPEDGISGIIEVSEMLGDELLLYIKIDDYTLIAKINNINRTYKINEEISFNIDSKKIHIFDSENKKNITI